MTTAVVAPSAMADLGRLMSTRGLPASTRDRVKLILGTLSQFPRLGPRLTRSWHGFRFLLGPWPWMLFVYAYDEATDEVFVVTIEDARTATSARSET